MEYMFFVLRSSHSFENLVLEPKETSKVKPLAIIDGLMHLLSDCVPGEQNCKQGQNGRPAL